MPVSNQVEHQLRDMLDAMAENCMQEINMDREFRALLKDHVPQLPEADQINLLHTLACHVHDTIVMSPVSGINPSFGRAKEYIAERMKIADWEVRYDAMQAELDDMLDDHVDSIVEYSDDE